MAVACVAAASAHVSAGRHVITIGVRPDDGSTADTLSSGSGQILAVAAAG